MYTDPIKDHKRGYCMMGSVLILITLMLCMDIYAWHRMARKMKKGVEKTEMNVQWYIPFYTLYYILMGLHIHFAQSAIGLGRRYRRLNMALKNSFPNGANNGERVVVRVSPIKNLSQTVDSLATKSKKRVSPINGSTIINGKTVEFIVRLAYIHESLGKAIENVSGAFGISVLLMLGSCLLHLVATAYFLFIEFLADNDIVFSWLQLLWLIFHLLRLLLIVEPCHVTSREANTTITILCRINRNLNPFDTVSRSMKKFWQQLLTDKPYFSACGMCKIDRQILTSFSGAIATYLVILIQFQKTDG